MSRVTSLNGQYLHAPCRSTGKDVSLISGRDVPGKVYVRAKVPNEVVHHLSPPSGGEPESFLRLTMRFPQVWDVIGVSLALSWNPASSKSNIF